MLDASLASPSIQPPASSESGKAHSGESPGDASGFLVLNLKEDDGACIATVLYAGFASVLRFAYDRHDDLVLTTGSDDFPCEIGGAEWWDCIGVVNDFMCGTEGERRLINARLAGEYLTARAA